MSIGAVRGNKLCLAGFQLLCCLLSGFLPAAGAVAFFIISSVLFFIIFSKYHTDVWNVQLWPYMNRHRILFYTYRILFSTILYIILQTAFFFLSQKAPEAFLFRVYHLYNPISMINGFSALLYLSRKRIRPGKFMLPTRFFFDKTIQHF